MYGGPVLQSFGPYDLVERISVGGTGEVFRAVSRRDRRIVALKRLMPAVSSDADVVETLHGEARLARSLDHPGIAKVVDAGTVDAIHYLAYEFVHGKDLRAIQRQAARAIRPSGSGPPSSDPAGGAAVAPEGRVPLDIALHIVMKVAEALGHAHARRDDAGRPLELVHRDVSPSNILVSFEGEVKLSDFGIARALGRISHTGAGEVKGTVGYMSPEQARGQPVDGRSDLFSLGICLWELVTGRRLFEGSQPLAVMQRIAAGGFPAPGSLGVVLPAELEAILVKALAQSPDRRYATGDDLHAELRKVARAERLEADPSRVARYVRSLFPEAAAQGAASREESLNMAENKGGSDLDVFEGLAKKPRQAAGGLPALAPPPSSVGPRQRTLVGGLTNALPPPSMPSGPHAAGALPPPSMPKPLPPPGSAAVPLPPPTPPMQALPPVSSPPQRLSAPGMAPPNALPPPTITPMRPPAPSGGLPAALPPPAAPSIGSTLGFGDPKGVPPPAAKPPSKKAASVDMDWDDEEESTHVYDKATHDIMPKMPRPAAGTPAPAPAKVSAAAALLASSGGAAAPAPQPRPLQPSTPPQHHSAPPPAMPGMQIPAQAVPSPPGRVADEPTALRARPEPRPAAGSKLGIVFGALALIAVLALAAFMLFPRNGVLKIDIKTKSGAAVDKAEIFVDGKKQCDTAPCVVADLPAGSKTIKVMVPGVDASEQITETVEGGKEKLVLITIGGSAAGPATADATVGTLKAAGAQPGVKVFLDDKEKGALPIDLKDVAPGDHKLRAEGEFYEPLAQSVTIKAGEVSDLGSLKLKLKKGYAKLELATPGATVTLMSEGSKKVEKKLAESLLKTQPKLELDPNETWKIVATKKGFDDFTQQISFEDGLPEKSVRIELTETGKASAAPTPPVSTGAVAAKTATPPTKTAEPPTPPPAAAGGNGTLNINSIPVSKVVLDGRPLGSTPKVGVSVPAGSHTVTFIHSELGKKSVSVTVKAGETKTAAVKFK